MLLLLNIVWGEVVVSGGWEGSGPVGDNIMIQSNQQFSS